MSKAYHIVQWNTVNETAESRKYRNLTWFAKSNKLVGMGISRLRAHDDRVALFAAWGMIEILASTAPAGERGWLVRNGKPLTVADMSFLTSFPADIFERAVAFFTDVDVAWLEQREYPATSAVDSRTPRVTGRTPGESPGSPEGSAVDSRTPRVTGRKSATDRQTDRQIQTDRRDKKGAAPTATDGDLAASKAQWAALTRSVKELEGLGSSIGPAQRQILRKNRALLRELEKKQQAGDFSLVLADGQPEAGAAVQTHGGEL